VYLHCIFFVECRKIVQRKENKISKLVNFSYKKISKLGTLGQIIHQLINSNAQSFLPEFEAINPGTCDHVSADNVIIQ
jgi:hypothetical protein